jgi:hypothetical protein
VLTEKFENFGLVVFSDFAESGTFANSGFFSGRDMKEGIDGTF